MAQAFDFKTFVLSWKNKAELKNAFWIVFASYLINLALGGGSLGLLATILMIYVGWKYLINKILFGAMKELKMKPAQVGMIEYVKIYAVSTLAVLFPWWTGTYLMLQIAVFMAAIFAMLASPLLSFLLILAYMGLLVHNGLRMNLAMPAYLEKHEAVNAVKKSWKMTEGRVVSVSTYVLKSIWYTITETWIFLVIPAIALFLALFMVLGGAFFMMELSDMGTIMILFGILGLAATISMCYSISFGAIVGQYTAVAIYLIFGKK